MFTINNKNMIILAIMAFIFYQFVNFIYFPISTVFPDEQRFLAEAIKFANSGEFWMGNSRAWEMPLPAMIYGTIYKIFYNIEQTIISIRITQSFMLIAQAFLIFKISLILFKNRHIAFISFFIMLFYPFFVYYQALLLSETIFVTIFVAAFYFLYRWYEEDFTLNKYFLLSNIFFTLTLYAKGTLSVLPPILITIFYFINKYKFKSTLKVFVYSVLIYTILMSIWWIRNYNILNAFVPFTTSSSLNLYLGANKFNKMAGIDWSKDVDQKFVNKVNTIVGEVERDKAYKDKALNFIKNNTGRYIELMWLKFKRFYNFTFNADSFNKLSYNLLSIFSYGSMMTFSIMTFILTLKNWKKFSAIYMMIGYFTLIHIVFIASLRYRLPLEPLFILLAPYSIIYIKNRFKKANE